MSPGAQPQARQSVGSGFYPEIRCVIDSVTPRLTSKMPSKSKSTKKLTQPWKDSSDSIDFHSFFLCGL